MPNRVTAAEVKVLILTSLSDTDVDQFIGTANVLVTEELADKGLSGARLKEIERYLSAHFVTMREESGGIIKTRTGESWDDHGIKVGIGLLETRYGQQAVALDATGTLRRMSSGVTSSFKTFPRKSVPTDSGT